MGHTSNSVSNPKWAAGWGDAGKRLFSYQRVTTDAINCEHLCLWKMNRDTLPHLSQGLTSGVPTCPSHRVKLRPVHSYNSF